MRGTSLRSVLSRFSCCNLTGVFSGLEVDGDLGSPGSWRSPGNVSGNGASSDVASITAECRTSQLRAKVPQKRQLVEMACDLRLWQQRPITHGKESSLLWVLDKSHEKQLNEQARPASDPKD